LVSYTGTQINGGYTLTVPARVTATLDYSHTGAIDMNVTAVKYPRWNGTHDNGSGGRDWNFATQNWTEYSTGAATTYQEPVGEPDFVYFDDNATGLTTVNIPAFTTVYPGQVNVNNNAKNYTFTGPGYISGTTALIKTGTGMLTITNNGGNNYTGGTKISEGTLSFATGVLPATGAIIMDGGTLQWNGVNSDDVSNRLIVNSGKTAILDTNNNAVTLASPLSFGSTSALTKVGLGTMTLTGSSTFTGDVNVNGGTLTANLSNNQPSPGLGLSALGNPIVAHNVNINSGGTLNFASSYTLGSPGTTPLLTLVINSLGTVTNTAGTFNPLGPVQLNGGSLTTNAGVDVNHQAFFLKGTVTVGGSSPSTISGSGSFSGIQMSAPTTFNVANVTLDSSTDLTVSTDLTDESASGTPPYPAASLTKTGAGTMTVTVNTTYTGNTYVNGGVLNMLNLNVPNSTVSVNNSGSTLNVQSLNTGTLTIGAGTTVVIKAITGGPSAGGSISPVPEPATWVMLLLAAMGLGIYRRRSR
jgi:autotransporter-associated beta strand protein